jgi:hypothetical protein
MGSLKFRTTLAIPAAAGRIEDTMVLGARHDVEFMFNDGPLGHT